jgi:hypothetical protein
MAGVLYSLAGRALVNLSFATAGECPVQIEAGLSDAEATETLKSVNVTRWRQSFEPAHRSNHSAKRLKSFSARSADLRDRCVK